VRGREKDGVLSFKGIPYAAPPFGAHRFSAPAAAENWEGVRDALEYGPTVPKPLYSGAMAGLLPDLEIPGEDCLNLNIWTPAADSAHRPVMVWIHGGAFVYGSGSLSGYDGSKFARDGIVCVTINYRLGVDGFLLIDGAPANRGLLDQIAALGWVRDNIVAFGGDPDAVTIVGESAGAMSVATLLTMPTAAGLFQRAIAQSGAGHHVIGSATAAKVADELANHLGIQPTIEGLSAVPIHELIAAQVSVGARIAAAPDPTEWAEIRRNLMPFEPAIDGEVLTARPIDRLVEGISTDVDVLIGSNAEEHALFLVPSGMIDFVGDDQLNTTLALLGADPGVVGAVYRAALPDASPGELLTAALTDWFYRVPAVRVAEARLEHGSDTYVFEFGWRSPQFGGRLGACHGLEIGFVFDNLDDPSGHPMAGAAPPQTLADEMHGTWVSFVKTGRPGWPAYGIERTVRSFGTTSTTFNDPGAPQRRAWDGIR
jgi:para-nitrobenzyl esterase